MVRAGVAAKADHCASASAIAGSNRIHRNMYGDRGWTGAASDGEAIAGQQAIADASEHSGAVDPSFRSGSNFDCGLWAAQGDADNSGIDNGCVDDRITGFHHRVSWLVCADREERYPCGRL